MEIQEVDPADEQAYARWFAVPAACEQEARPGEPGRLLHEQRVVAMDGQGEDPDERVVLLQAVRDGEVVGTARIDLPERDNRHLAGASVMVLPGRRGQGVGRALLEQVERRARDAGRTVLMAEADEPPVQEGASPSRGFARATGFELAQVEVRRDIALPLDPEVVGRLKAVAREHAADYALRSWRDRVPDDLVEDMAELYRRMSTDYPKGDLELQEEHWDVARVRRDEQQSQAMDRTWFGAGAVHVPTGRMVAYTEVGVSRSRPERVHQWDTLVVAEHRGNRLGMLVKLACLQQVSADVPQARRISTWNAQENAPMIRVNDALGAVVDGQLLAWQRRLD